MALQQVLAPQLQQSLALLQAPTLELKALVEQELEQNPVLEEILVEEMDQKERSERDGEGSTPEPTADLAEPPADVTFDPATEKTDAEPVDDFQQEIDRLMQLDQEWRDHFAQSSAPIRSSEEEEEKRQYMFDSLVAGSSLQENLIEQMRLSEIPEDERPIGELIIGNIDDYGYLKTSIDELAVWLSNSEVTFTKTDGTVLALGRVSHWIENYHRETAEQPRKVRRQAIRTVDVSGRFLADPKLPLSERQSFIAARREQWLTAVQNAEGTLIRQGSFNRVVRLVQFTAESNAAGDAIDWSLIATYTAEPDEREFAAVEFHVVESDVVGAPEKAITISGRIAGNAPVVALKLPIIRNTTLQAHVFTSAQAVRQDSSYGKVQGDDNELYVELNFEEEHRAPVASIEHLWLPAEDVLKVLKLIQTFHPPGVGARDLRECLMLQLERAGQQQSIEYRIVRDFMEQLGKRRIPEIAKGLDESVEAVQEAVARIGLLEPRPGRAFLPDNDQYILPEVFVNRVGDDFTVTTNNEQVPHLRISNTYKDLMSQPDASPEVKDYIREKIRAGKFLIKSLHQRQETIRKIGEEIVKRQREFMEKGVAFLKPMTMVQVAEVVGVHETTVSRAVSGKYMQTPQGLFEMKYFFTSGIQTSTGEDLSNTSVKDMIADLFKQEDPHTPLSDQEVVKMLSDKGIQIARRTVAKYRSELGILPSNLRKKY
jgi:RNA polymerase sigma-54 factor